MEMLVLRGLGHFLQGTDEEMTPVSALPEIMGLGGVGGKLTTILSQTVYRKKSGRAAGAELHTAKSWCSTSRTD